MVIERLDSCTMFSIAANQLWGPLREKHVGRMVIFAMADKDEIEKENAEFKEWKEKSDSILWTMQLDGIMGSFVMSVLSDSYSQFAVGIGIDKTLGSSGDPIRAAVIPTKNDVEKWTIIMGGLYRVIYHGMWPKQ